MTELDFELTEDDMFSPGQDGGANDMHSEEHSSDVEDANSEADDTFDDRTAGDIDLGPHSGSAKSTTLAVGLGVRRPDSSGATQRAQEAGDSGEGQDDPPGAWPTQKPPMGKTHSLPPPATVKMGSSVPINIPYLHSRSAMAVPGRPEPPPPPATFVPPHQLFSQRDPSALDAMGESPSTAIKRDRLRLRNAVLKSTGFLESGIPLPIPVTIPERPTAGSGTFKGPGGLSQALQMVGSPAVQ